MTMNLPKAVPIAQAHQVLMTMMSLPKAVPTAQALIALVTMMNLPKAVLTAQVLIALVTMMNLPRPTADLKALVPMNFVRKWAMKVVHIQAVTLKTHLWNLEFDLDDYALRNMHQ